MNRRTFLTLPLLGFASSVAKPVYGGMDLAGKMEWPAYSGVVFRSIGGIERVWMNGELISCRVAEEL
jgi:hypothetical protein